MRTLLPALLLAAPLSVSAGNLDYDYVGVGWLGVQGDEFSNERGYGVQGSAALGEHWLVGGEYRHNNGRLADVGSSLIGLGYRIPADEMTDVILRAGVLRYTLDGAVNRDDTAPFVEVSTRFGYSPRIDFGFGLRYADVDILSDVQFLANLQWKFGRWSLAVEFTTSGDGQTLLLGPRYTFR